MASQSFSPDVSVGPLNSDVVRFGCEAENTDAIEISVGDTAVSSDRQSRLTWTLIAAFATSLVSLPAVGVLDGLFPVENLSVEMTNRIRNKRDDPIAWAKERSNRWTSLYRTTAACLATFGVSVGIGFGLLESAKSNAIWRTLRRCFGSGLIGLIAGGLGGILEAAVLMKLESSGLDVTLRTMIGHAIAWSVFGAAMAIVCRNSGLIHPGMTRAMGRGIIAGVVAALIYAPAAAILFQLERSDMSIPEGGLNKLLFLASAAMVIGLGVRYWQPSAVRRVRDETDRTAGEPAGESVLAPSL